jgi:hypothetical protein
VSNTVSTPNGIVHDPSNDRLVFVNWGASAPIKAIDLSTYAVTTLTTTPWSNCDGIDIDGAGNFYVASWSPVGIHRYTNDLSSYVTVATTPLSNPADICYAQDIDVLGVPNSGNETLALFSFNPTAVEEGTPEPRRMGVIPNPVTGNSVLTFDLGSGRPLDLHIHDAGGRVVRSLPVQAGTGPQRLPLDTQGLAPGLYTVVLRSSAGTGTTRLLVGGE